MQMMRTVTQITISWWKTWTVYMLGINLSE